MGWLIDRRMMMCRQGRAEIGSRTLEEGNKGMKPIIKSLLDDARHRLTHHGIHNTPLSPIMYVPWLYHLFFCRGVVI